MATRETVIVGLSGVSSSGKTTLARLLRDIWPRSFVLHEDDFYWPDEKIPVKNGIQDWDCLEAINVSSLLDALHHVKAHGTLPPTFKSKEDQNSVGTIDIDQTVVNEWRQKARDISSHSAYSSICLVDGFLLYSQDMQDVRSMFDTKLFLHTSLQTAKARREARTGYVTIEGFWEDPPGYVDNVVWPNYVHDHAFLFPDDKVEGTPSDKICTRLGIDVMPREAEADMTRCLNWACQILAKELS